MKNEAKKPATLSLTAEQKAIVKSTGNIKINAVAGSGKTTTIIQYAASRPRGVRILYLAFNRSVRLEAKKRFEAEGLTNVQVETAHSLAFKHIVIPRGYEIAQKEYKSYEIAEILRLKDHGEKHGAHIIANHISKFVSYFCNSSAEKVQDLNYLDTVSDAGAIDFVRKFYAHIEHGTRTVLARMHKSELPITHDFYLKLFQLSKPQLRYDYILFDEGQDASAAMLDIFLQQKATKVIVGDTHQQIYGWRHAVNSLEKAPFANLHLSASFRFHQDIANLAVGVLEWKKHLQAHQPVPIKGKGKPRKAKTKATIARTNLGLLLRAITFMTEHKEVKHLYFEGNLNSYTYADEGASLYDVLSLYNGKRDRINDKLIGTMGSLEDLEEYIEKTDDVQLAMMVEIVKEYENEIPALLKALKSKQVGDEEKGKAEMVFSTVHRAKGMEYDAVQLVEDFITEGRLERLAAEAKDDSFSMARWNEEINLLYVAITRTRGLLRIPETMLPKDFPKSEHIEVIQSVKKDKVSPLGQQNQKEGYKLQAASSGEEKSGQKSPGERYKPQTASGKNAKGGKKTVTVPSYTQRRLEQKNTAISTNWNARADEELVELHRRGYRLKDMAEHLGRTRGAILARLKKLGHSFFD